MARRKSPISAATASTIAAVAPEAGAPEALPVTTPETAGAAAIAPPAADTITLPAALEGAGTATENPQPATDAGAAASGDGGQAQGDDFQVGLVAPGMVAVGQGEEIFGDGSGAHLPPLGMTVKITGPKKGRRRAGRAFGREPVLIPMEELTEDELTALMADPALTVELV